MRLLKTLGFASILLGGTIILTSCSGTKMLESAAEDEYNPVITHTATMKTTKGDIELELYGEDAPKTVKNFVGLAEQDIYDEVLFHRVIEKFMIQGGDPNTKDKPSSMWGRGGQSIYGGGFADELDPEAPSSQRGYVAGTLAMANAGPNTQSSQFFIITTNDGAKHLPYAYTLFGYVSSGMDVVLAIAKGEGNPPADPVKILDVETREYIKIKD